MTPNQTDGRTDADGRGGQVRGRADGRRRRNRREENTRSDDCDRPTDHSPHESGRTERPGGRRSWAGPSENGRIRNKRPLFKDIQVRKCEQCMSGILSALVNTKNTKRKNGVPLRKLEMLGYLTNPFIFFRLALNLFIGGNDPRPIQAKFARRFRSAI